MFASFDQLTFYLKNPIVFSRKFGKSVGFLGYIFQRSFCRFIELKTIPTRNFSKIFLRLTLRALHNWFCRFGCNNKHTADHALDDSCRLNKPMSGVYFSDHFYCRPTDRPTDRPTHILEPKMTRTQVICDLGLNKMVCIRCNNLQARSQGWRKICVGVQIFMT